MRHGETRYTGVFPDLTDEGVQQATRAANVDAAYWMRRNRIHHDDLRIVSSPAPRAHGTADIAAKVLRHPYSIALDSELGPMAWRDTARAKAALGGLSGRGYIDYETEPTFGDPEIFETQSEMRERWASCFARYIADASRRRTPTNYAWFSHYEVLCHPVREIFGVIASRETALRYAESIELSVRRMSRDVFHVSGRFRDLERVSLFDIENRTFSST